MNEGHITRVRVPMNGLKTAKERDFSSQSRTRNQECGVEGEKMAREMKWNQAGSQHSNGLALCSFTAWKDGTKITHTSKHGHQSYEWSPRPRPVPVVCTQKESSTENLLESVQSSYEWTPCVCGNEWFIPIEDSEKRLKLHRCFWRNLRREFETALREYK